MKRRSAQPQHKGKMQATQQGVAQQQAERAAQLRALAGAYSHSEFATRATSNRIKRERAQRRSIGCVLLSAEDLWAFGVRCSRVQLWKLVRAGLFPAPIKISTNRNAWVLSEVLAWVEERKAQRDSLVSGAA